MHHSASDHLVPSWSTIYVFKHWSFHSSITSGSSSKMGNLSSFRYSSSHGSYYGISPVPKSASSSTKVWGPSSMNYLCLFLLLLLSYSSCKKPSMEARILTLEVKVRVNSQPKEGDVVKKDLEIPTLLAWGWNRMNATVTFQASSGKCNEYNWLLGLSKRDINMRYNGEVAISCASVSQ